MAGLADFRAQYPQYNDMSDQELADSLHATYYSDIPKEEYFKQLGVATGIPQPAGFVESLKTGVTEGLNATPETAAGGLESIGLDALGQWMRPTAEDLKKRQTAMPTDVARSYKDIDSLSALKSYLGYGVGQVAQTLPTVLGAGTGFLAAGPAGAAVGAGAPAFLQNTGDAKNQFVQEGIPEDIAENLALGVGAVNTGLDLFSLGKVAAPITNKLKQEIISLAAQKVSKTLVKGAATEGTTEAIQQAIQEAVAAASGGDAELEQRITSVIDSGVFGAIGGTVGSGAAEVTSKFVGNAPKISEEEKALDKIYAELPEEITPTTPVIPTTEIEIAKPSDFSPVQEERIIELNDGTTVPLESESVTGEFFYTKNEDGKIVSVDPANIKSIGTKKEPPPTAGRLIPVETDKGTSFIKPQDLEIKQKIDAAKLDTPLYDLFPEVKTFSPNDVVDVPQVGTNLKIKSITKDIAEVQDDKGNVYKVNPTVIKQTPEQSAKKEEAPKVTFSLGDVVKIKDSPSKSYTVTDFKDGKVSIKDEAAQTTFDIEPFALDKISTTEAPTTTPGASKEYIQPAVEIPQTGTIRGLPVEFTQAIDDFSKGTYWLENGAHVSQYDVSGLVPSPDFITQDVNKLLRQGIASTGGEVDHFGYFANSFTSLAQKVPALRPAAKLIFNFKQRQTQIRSQLAPLMASLRKAEKAGLRDQVLKLIELADQHNINVSEPGTYTVPVKPAEVFDEEGKITERTNYVHTVPGEEIVVTDPLVIEAMDATRKINKRMWDLHRDAIMQVSGYGEAVHMTPEQRAAKAASLPLEIATIDMKLAELRQSKKGKKDREDKNALKSAIKELESSKKPLQKTLDSINAYNQFNEAFKEGHIPHVRFGNWYAIERDAAGNDKVFRLYNKIATAPGSGLGSRMVRNMQRLSKLGFKDDTKDIRKSMPGAIEGQADRNKLRAQLKGHASTMQQLISNVGNMDQDYWSEFAQRVKEEIGKVGFNNFLRQRQNVPGYETDYFRALESYVNRGARAIARMESQLQMPEALTAAATGGPLSEKYAEKSLEYAINNVSEEFQGVKNMAYIWTLGARMSAAVINSLQVPMVSHGWLSTTMPNSQAAVILTQAYKDIWKATKKLRLANPDNISKAFDVSKLPPKAQPGFQSALERGLIADSVVVEQAGFADSDLVDRTIFGKSAYKISRLMGLVHSGTEALNRSASWMAAWRAAQDRTQHRKIIETFKDDFRFQQIMSGTFSPEKFADFFVEKTQFSGGRGDRPMWMRGTPEGGNPLGVGMGQFMYYPLKLIESIFNSYKTPETRKAAALMLGSLVFVGGFNALPFFSEAKDAIKFLTRLLKMYGFGDVTDLEKELADIFGKNLMYGPFSQALNIDLSSRVQPRVVPESLAKGLNTVASGEGNAVDLLSSFFGPSGLFIEMPSTFHKLWSQGRDLEAYTSLLPIAGQDAVKSLYGMRHAGDGILTQNGNVIYEPQEIDAYQRLMRGIGFTTAEEADKRRRIVQINNLSTATREVGQRVKNQYYEALADLIRARKRSDKQAEEAYANEAKEYMQQIKEYNASHKDPADKILLDPATIKRELDSRLRANAALKNVPIRARKEASEMMKGE